MRFTPSGVFFQLQSGGPSIWLNAMNSSCRLNFGDNYRMIKAENGRNARCMADTKQSKHSSTRLTYNEFECLKLGEAHNDFLFVKTKYRDHSLWKYVAWAARRQREVAEVAMRAVVARWRVVAPFS